MLHTGICHTVHPFPSTQYGTLHRHALTYSTWPTATSRRHHITTDTAFQLRDRVLVLSAERELPSDAAAARPMCRSLPWSVWSVPKDQMLSKLSIS